MFLYRLPGAIVVCAGMGSERAMLAVDAAFACGSVSMLVSAGLAGGCDPSVAAGSVIEAGMVVDASSGERFATECEDNRGVLVTTHAIAGVQEKQRLFASYGAAIVDMEAATVARLARAHGVPFRAIKAVSDAHDFEMTSMARFRTRQGSFRTGRFALHTAVRPHTWRRAMELGAGSQRALQALTERLRVMSRGD